MKTPKQTYILLAKRDKLVKIGESEDPLRRIAQIRKMSPCPLMLVALTCISETELHTRFSDLRHHGEWFYVDEDMICYFENLGSKNIANTLREVLQCLTG